MSHCRNCLSYISADEAIRLADTGVQCPGCPACSEKDQQIARFQDALLHAEAVYRENMMQWQSDRATADLCEAENARLRDAAKGTGMVSEMADMEEVAVLVVGLHARALDAEAALKAVANAAMSYDLWMQEPDPRGGVRADHVELKLLQAWEACEVALALPAVRKILEAPLEERQ